MSSRNSQDLATEMILRFHMAPGWNISLQPRCFCKIKDTVRGVCMNNQEVLMVFCDQTPDEPHRPDPGWQQEEDLHQETSLHVGLRPAHHRLPPHTAAAGHHRGAIPHGATWGERSVPGDAVKAPSPAVRGFSVCLSCACYRCLCRRELIFPPGFCSPNAWQRSVNILQSTLQSLQGFAEGFFFVFFFSVWVLKSRIFNISLGFLKICSLSWEVSCENNLCSFNFFF